MPRGASSNGETLLRSVIQLDLIEGPALRFGDQGQILREGLVGSLHDIHGVVRERRSERDRETVQGQYYGQP
jgi:hypothetical protein